LEDFSEIPQIFGDEEIFCDAFRKAELAQMPPEDHVRYQHSLKIYRDIKNVIDSAYDEGKLEGKAEGLAQGVAKGKLEIARAMKAQGLDISLISTITGLSMTEIKQL
jgi:predicted transposase/invertase (TIGR01784 family)